MFSPQRRISSVDLRTGRVSTIPGSEGLCSPRISPDGRFIVAIDAPANLKLFLFDQQTQKWSELANSQKPGGFGWSQWSSDSKSVYISDFDHGPVIDRVNISERKIERVAAFELPGGVTESSWMSVAPDGSFLLLRDLSIQEIYALDVDWP
jgi:Tol biopolymer transport system component